MAIEIRIPTILRTYTGGAKSVEGSGATLADLLDDVESRHGGLQPGWSMTPGCGVCQCLPE